MDTVNLTDTDIRHLPSWELFGDPLPSDLDHARRFYDLGQDVPDHWPEFVLPDGWICVGIFARGDAYLAHYLPAT